MPNSHYYGRVRAGIAIDDLTLVETSYAPRMSVPAHAHHNALLVAVVQGGFLERSSRTPTACDAGSVLYHPRHEAHAHNFYATSSRCLTVMLGERWLARVDPGEVALMQRPNLLGSGARGWLPRRLYAEFQRGNDASTLALEGLVFALLGELAPSPSRHSDGAWIKRVRDVLAATFRQPPRLAQLAELARVHPVHLSRAFHRKVGCTLSEFVLQRRVEFAKAQLSDTDSSLSSVALDAGFADQGHFTRRFKAVVQMTPGEYRRRSRTGELRRAS